MAQPQIDISQLNDDLRNRLLNENSTIEVLLTANRAITTEDIEISSGTDIGKKPFLTPDSAGTTVELTLNDIGNTGDIINFSGNVLKSSAVLQINEGTGLITNLTGSFNAFTVSNSQLCVLRKLGANVYRIDGSYTEIERDLTPPVLQGAVVENTNPSELVLLYDENIDTLSLPANGDFSVNDGAANAVTNVAVNVQNVVLTLTNPIDSGDTVTVSYTAGVNPIQDVSGNDAANLVSQAVTNNVAASGLYSDANAANANPETTGSTTGFTNTNNTGTPVVDAVTFTNGSESVSVPVTTSQSSQARFAGTGILNGDQIRVQYDLYIESSGGGSGNVFARLNSTQGWDIQQQLNIGTGSRDQWLSVDQTATATQDTPEIQVQANSSATNLLSFKFDNIRFTKLN